jgi:hypothetical protein
MSVKPVYSDLFAFGRHTIVWLRVFRPADGVAIVLALSPTDQPGAGPVNDAGALAAAVSERFPNLGPSRLMVRFPDGPGPQTWTEISIDTEGRADFTRYAAAEVEALLGTTLPDPEDPTCAGIGGADHPLLALLPADEPERNPIDELVVIAVADLPFPHNPSECHWKDRFEQLRELYPAEDRERQVVGAHFSTTLAPEDLAACRSTLPTGAGSPKPASRSFGDSAARRPSTTRSRPSPRCSATPPRPGGAGRSSPTRSSATANRRASPTDSTGRVRCG